MGTLIKNGTVVNATGSQRADVLIQGEKIAQVAANISNDSHQIVDATNLLVMPGGIDVHTHLDMPFGGTTSADDYTTGTQAAAEGHVEVRVDVDAARHDEEIRCIDNLVTVVRNIRGDLRNLLALDKHVSALRACCVDDSSVLDQRSHFSYVTSSRVWIRQRAVFGSFRHNPECDAFVPALRRQAVVDALHRDAIGHRADE